MKKSISLFLVCVLSIVIGICAMGCGKKADVVIVSSMENFRTDKLKEMLKEAFPDLKIEVSYMPSGTNAAKIKAEGIKTEADIVLDIDYGYLESLKENFAGVTDIVDTSVFEDGLVPADGKYVPLSKFSIGVIINEEKLNGAPVPTSYDDLIKPDYRGMILMPSPKASGTGYGFLKGMVALKGEEKALEYFDALQKNIEQFTSSGSGPVNKLVMGECAIGIGMFFQAVQENGKGANLKLLQFSEGTPYNLSGIAVIKGREAREPVKNVLRFIANDFLTYDKVHYMPEKIFKNQPDTVIENYPNIENMDMKGFDPIEKERLLEKWKY